MLTEHIYLKKHIASTQQDKPMNEWQFLNGFYASSKTGNLNIAGGWEKRLYRDGDVMCLTLPLFSPLTGQSKLGTNKKNYIKQTASLTTYVHTPVLTLCVRIANQNHARIWYGRSSNCKHFSFSPYMQNLPKSCIFFTLWLWNSQFK